MILEVAALVLAVVSDVLLAVATVGAVGATNKPPAQTAINNLVCAL